MKLTQKSPGRSRCIRRSNADAEGAMLLRQVDMHFFVIPPGRTVDEVDGDTDQAAEREIAEDPRIQPGRFIAARRLIARLAAPHLDRFTRSRDRDDARRALDRTDNLSPFGEGAFRAVRCRRDRNVLVGALDNGRASRAADHCKTKNEGSDYSQNSAPFE